MAALFVSRCRGWQSSLAVLVGLQEVATGRKNAVKAGGEASNVCGDIGEDTRCGLIVVGDLGDSTGLFPDCEASAQHLSPGVVLSGRVSGQSDRAQSDQIWVPGVAWLPP